MTLRLEEIPNAPGMPESYVTVAVYGGTSNFPLTTFSVLSGWWEMFCENPDLTIVPLAPPCESCVRCGGPVEKASTAGCMIDWKPLDNSPKKGVCQKCSREIALIIVADNAASFGMSREDVQRLAGTDSNPSPDSEKEGKG